MFKGTRNTFMCGLFSIMAILISFSNSASEKRPNFVFIISEDNSYHHLKLYNQAGAKTPHIESLANNGLVFNNAFSNAPVCSTARTTLATGAYGPKIGTFYHRAFKQVNLPEGLKPYSQTLKESGYYTTNNAKTDYNFLGLKEYWSESSGKASWKKRKKGQPFFHMQTFGTTHENTLHFPLTDVKNKPTKHSPSSVVLPSIYPDTEVFRYTQARYLDLHLKMDEQVGRVIKQLANDGVLEDTFVFYFGDHGGVLPASKGYATERGLHIPLVVRVPKNFKHLLAKDMQEPSNTRVDGFVSFVDFAPTLLSLAGLETSKHHDGRAFLGKGVSLTTLNKRRSTFGYADRFDEKSDLVRTIREGNFKYTRHYQPFYPDSLFNEYRYKQQAYKEWKHLFEAGKLTPVQAAFFQRKEPEALYDIIKDPHETNNLALNPKFRSTLLKLRSQLQKKLKALPDLGFYPESEVIRSAIQAPVLFGKRHKTDIAQLIDIADMQLSSFVQVKAQLKDVLSDENPWKQYWGLITLSAFSDKAKPFVPQVYKLLKQSQNALVKARAIEFLTVVDGYKPEQALNKLITQASSNIERVQLLNIAAYLHEKANVTFKRPAKDTWNEPVKNTPTYNSDRYMKQWLTARWNYISQ